MHSKYSVLEYNMSFKKSTIDYCTKLYYPYISILINFNKEKRFYLKKVYIYKNMFMCGSSNSRLQSLLYFSIIRND